MEDIKNNTNKKTNTVDFLFDFRLLICFLLIFQIIGLSVYVYKSKDHAEENGQHFVVDTYDVTATVLKLNTVDGINKYTYGFTTPDGVYITREDVCEEGKQYSVNDTIELKTDANGTIVDLDKLQAKNDEWEAAYQKNMKNRRITLIVSAILLVVTSVYTIRKYSIISKLLDASNGEFFQNGYTLDDLKQDSEKVNSEENTDEGKHSKEANGSTETLISGNTDVKKPVKKPVKKSVTNGTLDNSKTVKKSVEQVVVDDVLTVVSDDTKYSVKKNLDSSIKKPVKKNVDSSIKKPVKKNVDSSIKKPVKKNVDSSIKKPVQKNVDSSIKKPVKKNVDSSVKKPVKKSIEDSFDIVGKKVVKSSTNKGNEDNSSVKKAEKQNVDTLNLKKSEDNSSVKNDIGSFAKKSVKKKSSALNNDIKSSEYAE